MKRLITVLLMLLAVSANSQTRFVPYKHVKLDTLGSLTGNRIVVSDTTQLLERMLDADGTLVRKIKDRGNFLVATNYDSLGAAFDAMSALDTAVLYIPAGTYHIRDSLSLTYKRTGKAFYGIVGEPGATIIRAVPTYFDSLKNMLNVVTRGGTSSTDTLISNLNIHGIIFNFAGEGGTFRPWALAGSDSAWHALRSYRNDDWDRYNPGAAGDTTLDGQVLWADSQGLILMTIGRIFNLNITECSFDSSFYGAIRIRPYYELGAYTGSVEGGQITNCQFRAIRGGPAIANLWNGVRTISDNTFRNVACALFNGTGGNTFSHNRIEEYDSCGIYLDYANWFSVTDNTISEGAGPAIILSGNCVGIISNNSTLNIWADNSHLGVDKVADSTLAIIKIENSFGVNTAYPRGVLITNNVHSTSDANYDGYTQYYVGATPAALADSCKLNIISNNIIRYGLGKDLTIGVTNISRLKNKTFHNMVGKNAWDQSDSLWIAAIDTISNPSGGVRWMRILLPDGSWFYAAKDTSIIN